MQRHGWELVKQIKNNKDAPTSPLTSDVSYDDTLYSQNIFEEQFLHAARIAAEPPTKSHALQFCYGLVILVVIFTLFCTFALALLSKLFIKFANTSSSTSTFTTSINDASSSYSSSSSHVLTPTMQVLLTTPHSSYYLITCNSNSNSNNNNNNNNASTLGVMTIERVFNAIAMDWYYILLVPLSVPVSIWFVYVNWLAMKFFRHN